MPRVARPVALPLTLAEGGAPLRHRVADAVLDALRDGRLRPGDTLPATRMLARELGVSRGPVVAAYDELASAGFVLGRAGSGVVVAPGADTAARAGARCHVEACDPCPPPSADREPPPVRWDLRPGRPDTGLLDERAWRRAWRAVAAHTPGDDAGAGPSHAGLRTALADHLRRSRGVPLEPDDLLLVPGVAAALHALPHGLGLAGRTVAHEDPGYVEATSAFGGAGVTTVPVPVDEDGLDPALLPRGAAAAYVTPSHQYPLGARMPVTRRVALLEWARTQDALVLEDDYDGEFRYDVSPLPALRSLPGAADHVVYIGTASKLVAPSLRVAWVAPPRHLRDRLRAELERRGLVVNEATGHALAEFIASGSLTLHHARASRTYAARRASLVAALGRRLPGLEVTGVDAGLHVVLRLPEGTDDQALVDTLLGAGLAANPLTAYADRDTRPGLVLCYATLAETAADGAAEAVAAALGSATA